MTMNQVKLFFTALSILIVITASQANTVPDKAKELRHEIAALFDKIDFGATLDNEEVIHVNFTVNSKNEIIILSTSHESLDHKIKSELNYKTVKTKSVECNKIFTLPVRIQS